MNFGVWKPFCGVDHSVRFLYRIRTSQISVIPIPFISESAGDDSESPLLPAQHTPVKPNIPQFAIQLAKYTPESTGFAMIMKPFVKAYDINLPESVNTMNSTGKY